MQTDAFEHLYAFSRSHEDWNVDELFTVLIVLGLLSLGFQIIRSRDLGREMKRREQAERTLARAFHTMHHGLSMFDADRRMVVCNGRYAEMYGLPSHLLKPGTPLERILEHRGGNNSLGTATPVEYEEDIIRTLEAGQPCTRLREFADGRTICIMYEPTDDGGWVSTHEDITERRRLESRLNHLAHHDALTDLANRILLRERLNEALADLEPEDRLAILCLDLDHFKHINDTLGHPVGDALLIEVAARLSNCVRETDLVARMGGDEFAILQLGGEPKTATTLAARLVEVLSAPYEVNGHHLSAGTSIGIAIAPADGTTADHLLKNADLALYLAKSEGRGAYRFFEPEMDRRMHERRQLELDLRRAIGNGEFELYYQPILDLSTNAVGSFEALLRWHHPEREMISPGEFIPIAEETGLIVPIGEWVLRQACAEAATWPGGLGVSVNVSPVQFKSQNLVQSVFSALAASGLPPDRLELEITETVLLQNTEATLATLHQLRAIGVRIAMDDFGVGYSSLSYFQSFPFDKIKLDRSFISGLSDGNSALAILRAVASLGANLSIVTTAEGVETEEQLAQIRREGISQIQGFLISPPRPAREIAQLTAAEAADSPAARQRQRSGM
jgi:diguanylate cyclase (GGDEF)-like protein